MPLPSTSTFTLARHLATMTATRVMTPLPPHLRSRIPSAPPAVEEPIGLTDSEYPKDYTRPRLAKRPISEAPHATVVRGSTSAPWEQDRSAGSRSRMTEEELYEILRSVDPSCPGLKISPREVATVLVSRVQRNVAQLIRRHIARICAHHAPFPE
ncbi:hypothetical protein FOZ63_011803, partial [Perkinsus olseni]